jgi:phosphoglycerate dehydrogenase-like enzyme
VKPRIEFFDDDHVMQCARLLLDGGLERTDDREWLEAFFDPDPLDLSRIEEITAGLTVADGVGVAPPGSHDFRANALLFRRGTISRGVLSVRPGLRLVQRLGDDHRSIDLVAARERRVEVSCVHRGTLDAVAEHVLLLILALSKRLPQADRAVREWSGGDGNAVDGTRYNWAGVRGVRQLRGATLGIIGLGEVGITVARLAHAFGMRVIYATRTVREDDPPFGSTVDLSTLLSQADVVSLHAPGDAGSPLIDAAAFAAMKPGALFVNTARGNLVDEDALYDALVSSRLAGAALDVHATEPRAAEDRFCALDTVILTPHLAAGSSRVGVLDELGAMFDNVRALAAGSPPPYGRVTLG